MAETRGSVARIGGCRNVCHRDGAFQTEEFVLDTLRDRSQSEVAWSLSLQRPYHRRVVDEESDVAIRNILGEVKDGR